MRRFIRGEGGEGRKEGWEGGEREEGFAALLRSLVRPVPPLFSPFSPSNANAERENVNPYITSFAQLQSADDETDDD